jgi:hypothetical protein
MPPEQPRCFGAYRLAGPHGPRWCGPQAGILGPSLGGSRGQAGGAGAGGRVRGSTRTRRARVTRDQPTWSAASAMRAGASGVWEASAHPTAAARRVPRLTPKSQGWAAACYNGGIH